MGLGAGDPRGLCIPFAWTLSDPAGTPSFPTPFSPWSRIQARSELGAMLARKFHNGQHIKAGTVEIAGNHMLEIRTTSFRVPWHQRILLSMGYSSLASDYCASRWSLSLFDGNKRCLADRNTLTFPITEILPQETPSTLSCCVAFRGRDLELLLLLLLCGS